MSAAIDLFVCIPLAVRLTRPSCAARHERAKRETQQGGGGKPGRAPMIGNFRCANCRVGAAHARDETPTHWMTDDGSIHLPIESSKPIEVAAAMAVPEEETEKMKTYAERKCDACEKPYTPAGPSQHYCGDECSAEQRRRLARERRAANTAVRVKPKAPRKRVRSNGAPGAAGKALADVVKTFAAIDAKGRRSAAAELLLAAGYSVTESTCPRGVVLIVEG